MKQSILSFCLFFACTGIFAQVDPYKPDPGAPPVLPGYKLVWSDEFNNTGKPSSANWSYETGFVRNEEHQWYQSDNANCVNGALEIVAKKERVLNPNYVAGSTDWKKSRQYAEYTSSAIHSRGKKSWKYGRFEIRAKIPATTGAWPAIWTLGDWGEWPTNGEIDIMEYYGDGILANACWGSSTRWQGIWDSSKTPMSYFKGKDANWANKYHIWVMDWTPEFIKLYLDGELLNTIETAKTINADGTNPFTSRNHYALLNLALGGVNGGDPTRPAYPITYFVDYIRVYQLDPTAINCFNPLNALSNLAPDPACDKAIPDGTGSRKICRDLLKVYCGNNSAEITGGTYAQYINWTPSKTYRVRAMVYPAGNDVVLGANGPAGEIYRRHELKTNLNEWQLVDFVFTAPETTGNGGGIFLSGASGSRIDNVEVYETSSAYLTVSRSNLSFDLTRTKAYFRVTGNNLTSDVTLTAPAGITLDKTTITPEEVNLGVLITAVFDGSRAIGNEHINVVNNAYSRSIAVKSQLRQQTTDNLAEGWDANGATGTNTEPNKFGWIANGTITWRTANATSDVRYSDQTTTGSYMLNGSKWSGRLLHTRWDSGVNPGNCFAYPVELEAGKTYTFSGVYGWQANGGEYSIFSAGVSTDQNNKVLPLVNAHKSIKKTDIYKLQEFISVFTALQDGTHYLTFDNSEKIMGAVGSLKLREGIFLPAEVTVSPATMAFNDSYRTRTISLQGKYLRETVRLTAPEGITLSTTEVQPDDVNGGITSVVVNYAGTRTITGELITISYGSTSKTILVSAQSAETSLDNTSSNALDFKATAHGNNVQAGFYLQQSGLATFDIFSMQGLRVATLQGNYEQGANRISIPFQAAAGNYIIRMRAGVEQAVQKLVVIK